ncbi:MAG TPA: hypothetical protein VJR94_07075 [Candidatus Nitrosocosmicus sp.]|nr:hypothetical protein [Candidatus Nitrosocosmicus sp.]
MYNTLSQKRIIATSAVMAFAFIMVMGPSSMAFNVFATTNDLEQEIEQSQYSTQLGICVSGGGTLFSCNNLNLQAQNNEGSNAAAQSSDDDGGDNEAEQSIEQEQDSDQSALCVSGSGTFVSCNNVNIQLQNNAETGSNALAQSSGEYGGDNDAEQSIEQEQDSEQSSQVASGDDSILSGNNVNVQAQNNEGSNAAAQSSGGDDDHDGGDNDAEQSIEQEQESEQDSQVASGDDSVGSGNNVNVQAQNNEGSNAAAQE